MVVGDSAFGFSGMEVETACRYKLPLKIFIVNNNGISKGEESLDEDRDASSVPAYALLPSAKYEYLALAFGGKGVSVSDHTSLAKIVPEVLSDNNLWIVNIMIDPSANRKE